MSRLRDWVYCLLRWSEKYTKTDMIYLTKGGFWTVFGQFFSSLFSLVLLIIFANILPKDIYGTYRYVLSLASILNVFTLTGANNAVSQAVAAGDDGALRSSVRYQLKWNLLVLIAFICLGSYYLANDNYTISISLFVMGIFAPLTAAFNTYGAFLHGKKNFKLNNIFSILAVIFYVLAMITIAVLNKEVIWLTSIYALITFATTAIFYFSTIKIYKLSAKTNSDHLSYGKKLTIIGFMAPISSQIDTIIVNHFWGAAPLAIYSLAMAVPSRATTFIKDWANLAFPKLAVKSSKEVDSFFYHRIAQGLLIGIVCAFFYIILAPYIFKYLMPKYLESIFYSQILILSLIVAIPNRYISLLFTSQKLSRLIFLNQLIQNIIRIFLLVILGIWSGIWGLVLAQVLSSFCSLTINTLFWRFRNFLNPLANLLDQKTKYPAKKKTPPEGRGEPN